VREANIKKFLALLFCLAIIGCSSNSVSPPTNTFTIAVIPDTQNYVDYTRQQSTGFAIDSSELFIQQMKYISDKGLANGGDVVFVSSVGDVWQHLLSDMDPEHLERGIDAVTGAGEAFSALIKPEETLTIEIPKSIEGYQYISNAGIPFGVAPGNHDYDAWWIASQIKDSDTLDSSAGNSADNTTEIHIGGLDAFRTAFGSETAYFRDKPWYVSSFKGGASSAQVFSGGAYQFLHLALEMQPGDDVLNWAQGVINQYAGLPTIVTTHDYLSARGERRPYNQFDLSLADPGFNNSAEILWSKFISRNDQIFLVLCGHQLGQALLVDINDSGHEVYQILADYQGRGQAGLDAGQPLEANGAVAGVGDGWYREMTFHLTESNSNITIKTYSTHYHSYSSEMDTYAQWYKKQEQPQMTDMEFFAADEFVIQLRDFNERFKLE